MSELEKKATVPDGAHNNTANVASHLEHANTHGTYLQKDEVANLTAEHRQYLLDKHGSLELDPLPSMNDADPYNWPRWKVCAGHHSVFYWKVMRLILTVF